MSTSISAQFAHKMWFQTANINIRQRMSQKIKRILCQAQGTLLAGAATPSSHNRSRTSDRHVQRRLCGRTSKYIPSFPVTPLVPLD